MVEKDKPPGKPKVFKIVVSSMYLTKTGWKTSSKNVLIRDGYELYVEKYGE